MTIKSFKLVHTLRLIRFCAGFKGAVLGLLLPDPEYEGLVVADDGPPEGVSFSARGVLPSCLRFLFMSARKDGLGLRLGKAFFLVFL